ncbi:DEAD/DEAH box helicase [Mesorhizobium delmotii]|uniref:DEAD/DEAH box helicase n=2 Tax=Mesorhizobium TaxID=68287 RepID=A0A2P9ALH2_9HYPH|nr:DEAD/DEAH box helicase [Mesorhizobium delmotii]SJM31986.1 conserved hypothetical protein [Mesorhizobium delmotii]
MTLTIQETIVSLQSSLIGYIEATYHIADPKVVAQRHTLLEQAGGIFQPPYLESTPRYQTGAKYAEMEGVPSAALEAYLRLSNEQYGKPLLFDPPYTHQADAIRTVLKDQANLMIMTGTGSGKTESFLLPILGKLAIEARDKSEQFLDYSAVRAMVLYPMNALVNDQLGRLRLLFGHERVRSMFIEWSGRTAKFARYTSRTPYAGVRSRKKDGQRLRSIGEFFVEIDKAAERHLTGKPIIADEDKRAFELRGSLMKRGKWPAKEDITEWFGSGEWKKGGEFCRAVTLDDDAELLTRYEAQKTAPDLLITNYSMLEYMMLRPIERTIFDQTREWLAACPNEKFLIVLDEAHLYRGAQGAEVGLLLRRLRDRLGIPPERFQVICATASFSEEGKKKAGTFGNQLSGVPAASFVPVLGDLKLRKAEAPGVEADVQALNTVDLNKFFSDDANKQAAAVSDFLNARGVVADGNNIGSRLYDALSEYGPFSLLVNSTMRAAQSFDELRDLLFPKADPTAADRAVNSLIAMGSRARRTDDDASLLPCRVHAFFRGLPGLWACLDPVCTELKPAERGGPIGRLYTQPVDRCGCAAPVLPYFTCRYCGTSYARAYTRDVSKPDILFSEAGHRLFTAEGVVEEFEALDIMLQPPTQDHMGLEATYDLGTGRLNQHAPGAKTRSVFLPPSTQGLVTVSTEKPRTDEADDEDEVEDATASASLGLFIPCGCCGNKVRGGKTSVQDHQTKGDQPFQALVSSQISVQPPSPAKATDFAPLRGRKVLAFSDSRQVAARLAPSLQNLSLRDTLRALVPAGFNMVATDPSFSPILRLNHAWIAAVVAANKFGIRLRPKLANASETLPRVKNTKSGELPTTAALFGLMNTTPPQNLTDAIHELIRHNILGLEPLAVASVVEAPDVASKIEALPAIEGLAIAPADKVALARLWVRAWIRKNGVWFKDMPDDWWGTGKKVRAHKGDFRALKHVWASPDQKKFFLKHWVPLLKMQLCQQTSAGDRLLASNLSLLIGGDWRRCNTCTSVHRPLPTLHRCVECGSTDVHLFDPDNDPVFEARKGFYRDPVIEALSATKPNLLSIIAAEHTAQLGTAAPDEAFSQAEQHEMEFQDIDIGWREIDQFEKTSIDVLSSTTTMEVGIDIGELSGVALRNMPPSRANYQQRAGRAGRRGNAVATVVAFGSADSHDEHYFSDPKAMIRGQVVDPRLTLENPDIARRHIRAFLLQRYHEDRLPQLDEKSEGLSNLFSVLGTVQDFREGIGTIHRKDFANWLKTNETKLRAGIDNWLPDQILPATRQALLNGFVADVTKAFDQAIFGNQEPPSAPNDEDSEDDGATADSKGLEAAGTDATEELEADPSPVNDELVDSSSDNLLDRLLYWGALPRYAFPTDVATFTVFSEKSTAYRAVPKFSPSQGLNVALSQYAPNKQVWIKDHQYTSKAIYSPFKGERKRAWGRRRLFYECERCSHAKTVPEFDFSKIGERLTCEACASPKSFGPARPWFRPPGFAHAWGDEAPTVADEPNDTAYATRAKLIMALNAEEAGEAVGPRIRALPVRDHLLVSNSGPEREGYTYCLMCGRIESATSPEWNLSQPHPLPYPSNGDEQCQGQYVSRHVVLGGDFRTDIALFSLKLDPAFRLPPANSETQMAMRTICEALSAAACRLLQIEAGEILAEYRPALNDNGAHGVLVEVFLYDTLAGGAGFSPQMVPRAQELFEKALKILEDCPGPCDASCYRCLRTFRNKLDHAALDRFVGAQLLRHVMFDTVPQFPKRRAAASLELLAKELERLFSANWTVERHYDVPAAEAPLVLTRKTDGKKTLVDVHSPIAMNIRVFGSSSSVVEVIDELKLRRHLPEAVEQVVRAMG